MKTTDTKTNAINNVFCINSNETEINSDIVKIKDNIIVLNAGEVSDKVTKGIAGLEINRGTSLPFKIIYDESDKNVKIGTEDNLIPLLTQKVIDENIVQSVTGKDATIVVTKNNNSSNTIIIDNVNHAENSIKAIHDTRGQQIDTTYIKNITGSNNILTVTKGNNTTSSIKIDNVSHASSSTKTTQDSDGKQINTTYLKRDNSIKNDFNSCTIEGIYRFSGTLTNGWTGTSWGTLLVLNNKYNGSSGVSGTYLVQLALPTDNTIRMRQRVNTGAWTSWVTLARTTDNVASATKATQDGSGKVITSTYMQLTGGTLKGALNFANSTWNKVGDDVYVGDKDLAGSFCIKGANGDSSIALMNKNDEKQYAKLSYAGGNLISNVKIQANLAGKADNATNSDNATTAKKVSNTAANGSAIDLVTGTMAGSDSFRIRIGGSSDNGYVEIATSDNKNESIYIRQYSSGWGNPRTATLLDGNGNTSFPGTVSASSFSGNATSATKATQLNNRGNITASTGPKSHPAGLTHCSAYNNGYPASYGNVLTIYNAGVSQLFMEWKGDETPAAAPGGIWYRECRDNQTAWSHWAQIAFTTSNVASATKATNDSSNRNIVNTYATKSSPAFSGTPTAPTAATNINNTQIATTAFVHNLLGKSMGKTAPSLTALINWDSMKSANGGTDVRNLKNTTYGVTAYGGDAGGLNKGDIIFKQAFNTFDALLVNYTNDGGESNDYNLIPIWILTKKYNTKGRFNLINEEGLYWRMRGSSCPTRPSTTTRFNVWDQNCGIIEIYGVTYK